MKKNLLLLLVIVLIILVTVWQYTLYEKQNEVPSHSRLNNKVVLQCQICPFGTLCEGHSKSGTDGNGNILLRPSSTVTVCKPYLYPLFKVLNL